MKRKWMNRAAVAMACALILPLCPSGVIVQAAAQEESEKGTEAGFTMYYPETMAASEGETLKLEQKPEKIITLSNSALQIMVRCGIEPIAVTKPASFVDYPDWVSELPVIETGMSTLDTESLISMEPDLVIMGSHLKEDFGGILADAGIPVYYTSEGPSTTYSEVKQEAEALAKSFGTEEDIKEVEQEFENVEKRAAEFSEAMESKKAMILFSFPPSYQQTSEGYLGSILSMLPFENLSDTLIDPSERTAPLDMEKLVELNPEVLFAISPTASGAEELEASYKEEISDNPGVWEKLQAVENGDIIYLSSEYVTSKGIQIVNSINKLIDQLAEKFSVEMSSAEMSSAEMPSTEMPSVGETGVTIEYPAVMQEKGYAQALTLEKRPEKVVAMVSSPVLALYRLGVQMIAIPKSSVVTWPEDLAASAEQLDISMNENFDIETVIALEPDLVIMGYTSADTYGEILTNAGIPVYYADAGHTVSYDSIRQQTEVLTQAFGPESDAAKEMMQSFEDLEKRLEDTQEKYKGKTVMVLQSAPPTHYIQTKDGTLGSMMDMLGFTNVYENNASSMAEVDMEQALGYDPDLIVAVGASSTSEEHQKSMEEDFSKNQEYWDSIPAIADGDIIYLPVTYVSSAGISIIGNINQLIDTVEQHYEAEAK